MPNVINTITNRKEIEIQRDGEKVGVIYFDPADMAIIKRLREAQDKLAEVTLKTDKDADVETMLAEADRIDAELRKAVDYAFDYDLEIRIKRLEDMLNGKSDDADVRAKRGKANAE